MRTGAEKGVQAAGGVYEIVALNETGNRGYSEKKSMAMNKKLRKFWMAVGGAALFSAVVFFCYYSMKNADDYPTRQRAGVDAPGSAAVPDGASASDQEESRRGMIPFGVGTKASARGGGEKVSIHNASRDKAKFEEWAANSVREEFGATISRKSVQVELLRLRSFLMERLPGDWENVFQNIISRAFPGEAPEILDTLKRMDEYNAWLDRSKETLAQLSYAEMKELLWEERLALFGDDAAELWKRESTTDQIKDALSILNDSYNTSVEDKLSVYKSAIQEVYSKETREFLKLSRGNLVMAFLSMDSVQDELREQSPTDCAASLAGIRREMGYSDKEIEKLEERDARRDQRWENGYAYMRERERVVEKYAGPDRDKKLNALREKYFARESFTIAAEEKSGFFRYNRPRIYGKN